MKVKLDKKQIERLAAKYFHELIDQREVDVDALLGMNCYHMLASELRALKIDDPELNIDYDHCKADQELEYLELENIDWTFGG